MASTPKRKLDHLELAATEDVGFRRKTNLLECVALIHDSLPELALDELDISTSLFGKRLRSPLLIASMTGGSERSRRINVELAGIAQQRGCGFGLGSQRAMLEDPSALVTYDVRGQAPDALVLGNIGMVQAVHTSSAQLEEMVAAVRADALCVHLNPAQELTQPEGDRDFRGGLELFRRLAAEFSLPVVAKETGAGLSRSVAERLALAGVRHVDVGGAGGTSFVAVETLRLEPARRATGEVFREWGLPTAASLLAVGHASFETVIATGGIRTGLEVAQALALGASAAGIARPIFQAQQAGGAAAVHAWLDELEQQLRMAMMLVGARDLDQLRSRPRLILGELARWQSAFEQA